MSLEVWTENEALKSWKAQGRFESLEVAKARARQLVQGKRAFVVARVYDGDPRRECETLYEVRGGESA